MRFQPKRDKIPELNLVPMLDVLMTVLTFFIVISMLLTAEKGVDVTLTGGKNQPLPNPNEPLPDPMMVSLTPQGQLLVNQQPIGKDLLAPTIKDYLDRNEKGVVLLQADRNLPYEQVVTLLGKMRDIGGSKVSLALDEANPVAPAPATQADPVAPPAPADGMPESGAGTVPPAATTPTATTPTATTPATTPETAADSSEPQSLD